MEHSIRRALTATYPFRELQCHFFSNMQQVETNARVGRSSGITQWSHAILSYLNVICTTVGRWSTALDTLTPETNPDPTWIWYGLTQAIRLSLTLSTLPSVQTPKTTYSCVTVTRQLQISDHEQQCASLSIQSPLQMPCFKNENMITHDTRRTTNDQLNSIAATLIQIRSTLGKWIDIDPDWLKPH